jgi:hypothetical protein
MVYGFAGLGGISLSQSVQCYPNARSRARAYWCQKAKTRPFLRAAAECCSGARTTRQTISGHENRHTDHRTAKKAESTLTCARDACNNSLRRAVRRGKRAEKRLPTSIHWRSPPHALSHECRFGSSSTRIGTHGAHEVFPVSKLFESPSVPRVSRVP